MSVPAVKLNPGYEIPMIGLGTWQSKQRSAEKAIEFAIDCGYRHIDCAWFYKNEEEIGRVISKKISEGAVKREDLFITNKLWSTFHQPKDVYKAFKGSLDRMKLNYLDLYLMHLPMAFPYVSDDDPFPMDNEGGYMFEDTDYMDTWKAMEKLLKEGLVRSIGVSNFNTYQIDRVLKEGSVRPAVNQIELHPYLVQTDLVDHCKKLDIAVTAYCPLGSNQRPWKMPTEPVLLEDPNLLQIASRVKRSVAQVILRFQIERGVIVIPKSVTPSHIESNMQLFDFELSKEDMSVILNLDKNFRTIDWFKMKHKYYPFVEDYKE